MMIQPFLHITVDFNIAALLFRIAAHKVCVFFRFHTETVLFSRKPVPGMLHHKFLHNIQIL